MSFVHIVMNLSGKGLRTETFNDKEYLVVPTVMLTEGVHAGSEGGLFYHRSDLGMFPERWNMKPIVANHPMKNGRAITACTKEVIDKSGIGIVMNTRFDANSLKLRTESWIDPVKADAVDPRILQRLRSGETIEVSTGLFVDNVDEAGEYGGITYNKRAKNFVPDHLAVLLDEEGACSVAKGAGLYQLNTSARQAGLDLPRIIERAMEETQTIVSNLLSHSTTMEILYQKLSDRFPPIQASGSEFSEGVWIRDIYDSFVIYDYNGSMWKLGYSKDGDAVILEMDSPVQVIRVTEYRTQDGTFVGNTEKDGSMNKEQVVQGLIDNAATAWTEADRALLMAMEDAVLAKLSPVVNSTTTSSAPVQQPVVNNTQAAPITPVTVDSYLQNAPPEVARVINHGVSMYQRQHAELVAKLTANTNCPFTAEQLACKDVVELEGLVRLAGTAQPASLSPVFNYAGAGGMPVHAPSAPSAPTVTAMAPAGSTAR